jgi:hypothetical protein
MLFIAESRIPWIGGGIGFLLGFLIIIADMYVAAKPMLQVNHQFAENKLGYKK